MRVSHTTFGNLRHISSICKNYKWTLLVRDIKARGWPKSGSFCNEFWTFRNWKLLISSELGPNFWSSIRSGPEPLVLPLVMTQKAYFCAKHFFREPKACYNKYFCSLTSFLKYWTHHNQIIQALTITQTLLPSFTNTITTIHTIGM
jgi:hypothetical protein